MSKSVNTLDLITKCKHEQYAIKVHMALQSRLNNFVMKSGLTQASISRKYNIDKTELNRTLKSPRVSLTKLYKYAHMFGIYSNDPLCDLSCEIEKQKKHRNNKN